MFDEKRTYEFTEKISFPRLIGSKGWLKCREMIKTQLNSFGIRNDQIEIHKFKGSLFFMNFIRYYLLIPITGIIILMVVGYIYFDSKINVLVNILTFILFPIIRKLGSGHHFNTINKNEDSGKYFDCENIFVRLKSKKSKITLFLMGHYDTKTQSMDINLRIWCYIVLFIGSFVLCLLCFILALIKIIMFPFDSVVIKIFVVGLGIVDCFCAIILIIFQDLTNKSPGSVDNGTSVSLIMEICRIFKKKEQLENLDLVFLFTDAEEIGVIGATKFISKFSSKFDKENTYFLNFEGPGNVHENVTITECYGMYFVRKYTCKELNSLFHEAAKSLRIKTSLANFGFGSTADHCPAINNGFKATMMGSGFKNVKVHSIEDSMKNVSKKRLKEAGSIVERMIEMFNQKKTN